MIPHTNENPLQQETRETLLFQAMVRENWCIDYSVYDGKIMQGAVVTAEDVLSLSQL